MIVLRLRAREIATIIQQYGFDTIRIYRDTSQTGSFAQFIGAITPLSATQEYYEFADEDGGSGNWYEFSYYNSTNAAESPKSQAFLGLPVSGPMNLLTIGYVWSTTELPDLQNAPGSVVGEYIIRAETLLTFYGSRYGGWLTTAANWATIMPIAARMLLEDLWLRSRPSIRQMEMSGFTSERRSSYSYTRNPLAKAVTDWKDYFTEELEMMLRPFLASLRYKVHINTTQVFPELMPTSTPLTPNQDPNQTVKLWNDYLDVDFLPWPMGDQLLLGPGQMPVGATHRWSD